MTYHLSIAVLDFLSHRSYQFRMGVAMVRARRWSGVFVMVFLVVLCQPARGQVGHHSKKYRDAAPAAGAPTMTTTFGTDNTLGFVYQDFEGATFPPPGWTSQGSGWSIWIRSNDASGYGVGTGSTLASFYDIQSGSFSLVSPTFAPTVAGDSLRFDHAYCTYQTENDQLQISTSTDGGVNWTVACYFGRWHQWSACNSAS